MTPHKIPVKLILVLNLLAVLALLVYINNPRPRKPAPLTAPAAARTPEVSAETAPVPVAAPSSPSAALMSDLPVITCKTRDTIGYFVKVGVRFGYSDAALRAEIAEKQGGLATLVRYVFADKSITQIEAERCRAEILEKVNRYLTRGKVRDAVFTAFDIVPVPSAPPSAKETP